MEDYAVLEVIFQNELSILNLTTYFYEFKLLRNTWLQNELKNSIKIRQIISWVK